MTCADLNTQNLVRVLPGRPAGCAYALRCAGGGKPFITSRRTALSLLSSCARSSAAGAGRAKSAGCLSCHLETDAYTMHENPGVVLGCTDCHGGAPGVFLSEGAEEGSHLYSEALEAAHVLPEYPDDWHFPHSENPEQSYTLLNRESPIRPLRQPVGLSCGGRSLRRLPYGNHSGGEALDHGHRRHALGGGLQQRHPAL